MSRSSNLDLVTRYRRFESGFLQRRVQCEPDGSATPFCRVCGGGAECESCPGAAALYHAHGFGFKFLQSFLTFLVALPTLFDALACEIAQPIGMQDYVPSDANYGVGAASVYPAHPFYMSAS